MKQTANPGQGVDLSPPAGGLRRRTALAYRDNQFTSYITFYLLFYVLGNCPSHRSY
jgi:hypothetical protein